MDAEPPPARARVGIGVGAAIVLVLVVLVVAVLVSALAPRGSSEVLDTNPNVTAAATSDGSAVPGINAGDSTEAPAIFVHVLGSVMSPGLYQLRDGARVVDAVAAAGGYTAEADQSQLNLARIVADGEQLYAPAVGEVPPVPAAGASTGSGAAPGGTSSTLVDLNTADSAALETLPRIGPETAKKIIAYRDENGPFTSIDQLLEVPGIGQKTLDGLRDAAVV